MPEIKINVWHSDTDTIEHSNEDWVEVTQEELDNLQRYSYGLLDDYRAHIDVVIKKSESTVRRLLDKIEDIKRQNGQQQK